MAVHLSFNLAPEAALEFWRSRIPMTRDAFDQLAEAARTRAFTVAGLAKESQVAEVMERLNAALQEGQSFESFQASCAGLFSGRGWSGQNPWHMENVFRTNIQTAYNAGRYQQMAQVARERPWWRYVAVDDDRVRPSHRAMHGKVFPADSPVWSTWFPPNGYQCRCTVENLSQRQMERYGLHPEEQDPEFAPDEGFAGNPGADFFGSLDDVRRKALAEDYADLPLPSTPVAPLAKVAPSPETPRLARGLSPERYGEAFVDQYGARAMVFPSPDGEPLFVSARAYQEGLPMGDLIPLWRDLAAHPREIWLFGRKGQKSGKVRLVKRHVHQWSGGESLVVESMGGVVTHVEDAADVDRFRRGLRIWREDEEE